jgi:anti-sigma factor RsiW
MDHLTEMQILARVQGRLTPDDAGPVEAHLQVCTACRERVAAQNHLWQQLETWGVPPVSADLAERVLDALPAPATHRLPRVGWMRPLRAAAAILLAIGLGHVAGRLTWKPASSPPAPDEAAVAQSLHLDDAGTADILLAALEAPEGVQP